MAKSSRTQTKERRARVDRKNHFRRKGLKTITLGPNDAAVVLRHNGQVNLTMSRAQPAPGTSAFWGFVLRWLFQPTDDGAERREALAQDFMMDLNELIRARRMQGFREQARAELAERDDPPTGEELAATVEARAEALEEEFQAAQALDAANRAKEVRDHVAAERASTDPDHEKFTATDDSDLDWDEPASGEEVEGDDAR